jgi:hypothetical protein
VRFAATLRGAPLDVFCFLGQSITTLMDRVLLLFTELPVATGERTVRGVYGYVRSSQVLRYL